MRKTRRHPLQAPPPPPENEGAAPASGAKSSQQMPAGDSGAADAEGSNERSEQSSMANEDPSP